MFTGIITDLGTVESLEPTPGGARLVVTGRLPHDVAVGDSIAVDGVCVTVTSLAEASDAVMRTFTADLMPPTLGRTTLGGRSGGDRVNLEPALSAGGRFGGHVVAGHVDAVGTVVGRTAGDLADQLTVALPAQLARYVVPQGSIAVDGVSLTVAELHDNADDAGGCFVTIGLIPATLEATTLGQRTPPDRVNLEVDLLAKQVERLLAVQEVARA
ncbi:riboflavin synthase [Ruania alba]|uniref:Riboflavin synthase n=1 Tax=Ruania alba TaxID=648782 RepID=A0A1H5MIC9_9MICO|nr:riboflavin synthase [Ruania alba]SEE89139.1 riboflavin synthase alpha chain [Ruania alba]